MSVQFDPRVWFSFGLSFIPYAMHVKTYDLEMVIETRTDQTRPAHRFPSPASSVDCLIVYRSL
jgi:hypothetical protein